MQQVIRRTLQAEKQAARRLAKQKAKDLADDIKTDREQNRHMRRETIGHMKQARIARREDWELGPLAPRRDVGDYKDTYGTLHTSHMKGPALRPHERDEALEKVGGKFLHFREKDRVVLIEGRDKGKIGQIVNIDTERAECTIEGVNLIDIPIPKYMIDPEDPDQGPLRTLPKPVPLTSIRLVYPLMTAGGQKKDVIIKRLVNTGFWFDRHLGTTKWKRTIPGLNIDIPWPKKDPVERKDCPNDTLRAEVEQKSFVPSLLRPPMPSSVIDELRNKYSKFRTRHDPEYIEAKMEEDRQKEERKKSVAKMRTPLKEINRKERKLRKAKGKGKLTAEMLEKIGQIIANKRGLGKPRRELVAA